MKSELDALAIIWCNDEDGTRHYRCRGIGPTYKRFYHEWVPTSSYRCTGTDWPWDYFVLDDPSDHNRLVKDYHNDVWEEDE